MNLSAIRNLFNQLLIIGFLVISIVAQSFSQTSNQYGLRIISDVRFYNDQVLKDSNMNLVNIQKFIPNITLDIKYATEQNIFYTKLYDKPNAFIRLPVAKVLLKVEKDLNEKGLGLKIYDAYRPYSVTCRIFEMLPDTLYMGLPWYGSKHNRGIALDLTLIDFKTKKELKMPTPFDALVYPAHPDFRGLSEEAIRNRELLKATMHKYGFKVDPMEWWHYNYISSHLFDILDLPADIL
jgi:D-alanyl-D-alanine dipeptidase